MWVWLSWLFHDMAQGWARCHESVTAHVLDFHVISTLHGMMMWLALGVVGSYDEVLLVVHARTFEATNTVRLVKGPVSSQKRLLHAIDQVEVRDRLA